MTEVELPLGLDIRLAGDLQRKIVRGLNKEGMTYEVIAQAAGIAKPSSIRAYVVTQATPRRTNDTFQRLDQCLRSGGPLSHRVPKADLDDYAALFSGRGAKRVAEGGFDFELRPHQSGKNLDWLSRALHTAFQIDHERAVEELAPVCGTYHMYRCSVDEGEIIRSYVKIRVAPSPRPHVRFTHVHPDRHADVFKGKRPVTTMGIVISAGAAIHLLGNAENSNASNFIALHRPYRPKDDALLGFTTVSSERGLVSARVVLIRRPQAKPEDVRRMTIEAFDEGFDPQRLLISPCGLAAASSIL